MESLINRAIEWFKDISEATKELTSGNVSHKACAIRGLANGSAEYLEECKGNLSVIKWKTGTPKYPGRYLVQTKDGMFDVSEWEMYDSCWGEQHGSWSRFNRFYIVAWCLLSDIKPYKEEKK